MDPVLIKFTLIRRKIWGLIIFGLLTLLAGVGLLHLAPHINTNFGRFILAIFGFIILWISVFCLLAFFKLRQERFTAMYISNDGINDISTGNNIGTILWKDVTEIKVMNDLGSGSKDRKYIVLKVSNPNEYIQRELNRAKRRSLELKFQYYGSPICFSNRALNCSFDELAEAVCYKYNLFRSKHVE